MDCLIYQALFREFEASVKITPCELRKSIETQAAGTVAGTDGTLCQAAIECLNNAVAKENLRRSLLRRDGQTLQKLGFQDCFNLTDAEIGVLCKIFMQHAKSSSLSDDQRGIKIFKDLLDGYWRKYAQTFQPKNMGTNDDEKKQWLQEFQSRISGFELMPILVTQAAVELPPPEIGRVLTTHIIPRIARRVAISSDLNIDRFKHTYFDASQATFMTPELATEILMRGAPSAQWEIACVSAGLVKFEWKWKGNVNA